MQIINKDVKALVKKYKKSRPKFVAGETPISIAPVHEYMGTEEIEALVQSALELRITDGELSHKFELEMSRFLGTRYATFCNSGSSANLLAFMSLTSPKLGSRAIQVGDEVITCAVGFPTTVAPIIQAGAIPVFTDVSLSTYNPTPHMISDAITEKTKAIFIAHTLGNPFDVETISELAKQNNIWLIEDCADALSATFNNKKVGTFGNISTTSFYPAHHMTTGEGGMVFTDDSMLNQIIRSMRDWGRECYCRPGKDNTCGKRFLWTDKGELPDFYDHKYIYSHIGYNLKATDLQASIGLEQLKKLPLFIEKRRYNWKRLHARFVESGLDKYFILPSHYEKSNPAPFGFILTIREGMNFTRTELVQFLNERKIATRNLFGGNLTRQPGFVGKGRIADSVSSSLPKSDIVMTNTFWIGCHPEITNEMIEYIVGTFVEFVNNR